METSDSTANKPKQLCKPSKLSANASLRKEKQAQGIIMCNLVRERKATERKMQLLKNRVRHLEEEKHRTTIKTQTKEIKEEELKSIHERHTSFIEYQNRKKQEIWQNHEKTKEKVRQIRRNLSAEMNASKSALRNTNQLRKSQIHIESLEYNNLKSELHHRYHSISEKQAKSIYKSFKNMQIKRSNSQKEMAGLNNLQFNKRIEGETKLQGNLQNEMLKLKEEEESLLKSLQEHSPTVYNKLANLSMKTSSSISSPVKPAKRQVV